jgi:diguanylate cyclase (GGDEF)-like protein/PAS domain S-box-containing protein
LRVHPPSPFPLRELGRVLVLGCAYFALAMISVRFSRFDGGVACVWTATALLLAQLTLIPFDRWPARLLACGAASAAATALYGLGPSVAVPLAFINMSEAAGAAWLLRRLNPRGIEFGSLREFGTFVAVAGIAAPALSGVAGAICAGIVTGQGYGANWLAWFSGHALGTIVGAPLLLLVFGGAAAGMAREAGRRGIVEAIGLLTLVAGSAAWVFAQPGKPLLFLPFLPMVLAVFRLGRLGAVTSSVTLCVIAVYFTMRGMGPIGLIEPGHGARAQFLQIYLGTAVMTVLPAAAELRRRKTLFADLQQTSALQQIILDRTSDIIMRLGADGTVAYVSASIERVGGYTPERLIGRTSHDLVFAADRPAVFEAHQRALASPSETCIVEFRARRDDGDLGWFESHIRATVDEDGQATGTVAVIRETTARREAEAELERRASTDPLTGLANRQSLHARLQRELARGAGAGCLAMFDLDCFKAVNDEHGHLVGDTVLKAFAQVLRSTSRGGDQAARFGGEEFVLVLGGASRDEASAVVERIRRRFAALDVRDDQGRPVRTTVSAGLACLLPGSSAEDALKAADDALYRSKAAGRNRLTIAA